MQILTVVLLADLKTALSMWYALYDFYEITCQQPPKGQGWERLHRNIALRYSAKTIQFNLLQTWGKHRDAAIGSKLTRSNFHISQNLFPIISDSMHIHFSFEITTCIKWKFVVLTVWFCNSHPSIKHMECFDHQPTHGYLAEFAASLRSLFSAVAQLLGQFVFKRLLFCFHRYLWNAA